MAVRPFEFGLGPGIFFDEFKFRDTGLSFTRR